LDIEPPYFVKLVPSLGRLNIGGHGRNTRDARPFTYELLASDTLAIMDALHLEKAALVGWSDGAGTALILAAKPLTRHRRILFSPATWTRVPK
jgi:pimeloyl-ACP methyl ester carboxylesterase